MYCFCLQGQRVSQAISKMQTEQERKCWQTSTILHHRTSRKTAVKTSNPTSLAPFPPLIVFNKWGLEKNVCWCAKHVHFFYIPLIMSLLNKIMWFWGECTSITISTMHVCVRPKHPVANVFRGKCICLHCYCIHFSNSLQRVLVTDAFLHGTEQAV
jgi:hypothetical protein